MPRHTVRPSVRLAATLAASAALAACAGDDAPPEPLDPAAPSFTLQASGDVSERANGFTLTTYLRNGYREEIDAGRLRDSSDVTLVTFSLGGGANAPQVNIGLLGRPAVGTYRVRTLGPTARPIGAQPEFYGTYLAPATNGARRHYAATTGTVTITSVAPMIRGTFAFRSTMVTTVPENVVPGTTVHSTPANADFSGEFAARLP